MSPRGTNLGEGMLAAALHECFVVRQALARRDDTGNSIHEARKAIRRLRALLSLAGDRVDGLEELDAQLDRLGDGLSALRDAQVMIASSRRLADAHPSTPWPDVVAALERRRDTQLAQARAKDRGFARRRRALLRIEEGLQALAWPVRKKDLRAAIERSQQRHARAKRRAGRTPNPENVHRWRRRARRLRMQLDATRALAPKLAREVAKPSLKQELHALHALADSLGWFQDLQVLRAAIVRMRELPERATMLAQLNDAKLAAYLEFTPDRKRAKWIQSRGPLL